MTATPFAVKCDEKTGQVVSASLYGREMLDSFRPSGPEVLIDDTPVTMRVQPLPVNERGVPIEQQCDMSGEKWIDFWTGAGLCARRVMGIRDSAEFQPFGIQYWIRRELADVTQIPVHGPGGPACEMSLFVNHMSLLNWNWRFWGDDTRMIFLTMHSSGPAGPYGHVGYENDTPEKVKGNLLSVWRRQYPSSMGFHGGVFYDKRSHNWLAITCRRPNLGYILSLENAGRGVSYDFTLNARLNIGDMIRMPEIKIYYGETEEEMKRWMARYLGFYYHEPPEWFFKTHWTNGLAWDTQPTWTQQADKWEREIDEGLFSGISYSLVTSRPVISGTTPTSYQPDPNHGTMDEFKQMCLRVRAKGTRQLLWMSHSGLAPGAPDIDEDWFIRGVNGQRVAAWGDRGAGMYYVNPGHPGYIKYTKEWLRFYIGECKMDGVFFDCYGTCLPTDYTPRDFMMYPGQTALQTIKFMEEIYRHVKELNPEAIVLGEGASLDGPIDVFSVNSNPKAPEDGLGPRDFLRTLCQYDDKRFIIDQGPRFCPVGAMCKGPNIPEWTAYNKYLTRFLASRGGRSVGEPLNNDLSVIDDHLFVSGDPAPVATDKGDGAVSTGDDRGIRKKHAEPVDFELPESYRSVTTLTEVITGKVCRSQEGRFTQVPRGIYRMSR